MSEKERNCTVYEIELGGRAGTYVGSTALHVGERVENHLASRYGGKAVRKYGAKKVSVVASGLNRPESLEAERTHADVLRRQGRTVFQNPSPKGLKMHKAGTILLINPGPARSNSRGSHSEGNNTHKNHRESTMTKATAKNSTKKKHRKVRPSASGYSRPKVKISKGQMTLGAHSPWKGRITRVNPSRPKRNPGAARGSSRKSLIVRIATLLAGFAAGWVATKLVLNKISFFQSGWGLKLRGATHIAAAVLGYSKVKNPKLQEGLIAFGAAGAYDLAVQNIPGASSYLGADEFVMTSLGAEIGAELPSPQTVGDDEQYVLAGGNGGGGTDAFPGWND